MNYQRVPLEHYTSTLPKPIKSKTVTMLWGNDGWCYIPQLQIRQKYTENTYVFQSWDGVIAIPAHTEEVTWALYSESPRVWREQDEIFSQLS